MTTVYVILGKIVVGLCVLVGGYAAFLFGILPFVDDQSPLYVGHKAPVYDPRANHTPIRLLTADDVTLLDPLPLMDKDGRLPNVIHFQDRTFERCWTNEGNTDLDERLWCETSPEKKSR